jgi:hypothetical protein
MFAGRSFDDRTQWPFLPNLQRRDDIGRPTGFPPIWEPELEQFVYESIVPPAIVDSLLVRFDPFTTVHLTEQSGHFDPVSSLEDITEFEWPAELFFQSELFSDVNSLNVSPFSLAEPSFSLVYSHRIALERPETALRLNKWIDLVFGVAQKGEEAAKIGNIFHPYILDDIWDREFTRPPADVCAVMRIYGVMPVQLFNEPHPARGVLARPASEFFRFSTHTGSIHFAGRIGRELWILDGSGKLFVHGIALRLPQLTTLATGIGKKACLGPSCDGLVAYETKKLFVVSRGGVAQRDFDRVDTFVSSGNKLVAIQDQSILSVFDTRVGVERGPRLVMTEDIALCYAVSEIFHLLVVATRGDLLRYYSLKNLHQTYVVRLPAATARKIAITETWGFTVVDFVKMFAVFTVNGELIAKYEHDCDWVYWNVIASMSDFDYLAVADIQGRLLIIEAYRPERNVLVTTFTAPICFIGYEKQVDVLVVVAVTGDVVLVTHPFSAFDNCQ